jgi:hypothetical protein
MTYFDPGSLGVVSSEVGIPGSSVADSAVGIVSATTSLQRETMTVFAPRRLALRGVQTLVMALALLGVAGMSWVAFDGTPAAAQQHGPVSRSVQGKVVDKNDTALKGAVVYLKDDKTLAVKSYIVDDDGTYRFGQLSQSTDNELWAELDGNKSKTRTISSFDDNQNFVINLKISK